MNDDGFMKMNALVDDLLELYAKLLFELSLNVDQRLVIYK